MPSQIEPTIGGITPPSEFCAAHQPNGTEGDCHPCGRARRYRWNTWPLTDDGMTYNRDGSTMTTMARNQGKKRAKLAPLALAGGISIDEQQTRAVELMKRIGAQPPRGALPPGDDKGLDWLALGPQDGNGGQP
ncbi:hypothetical protein ACTXG5_22900 [Mycobacterium sp. Dal123C01]|uniref:hypothetical protein n=1 Tax=Mycobacterium sp. Dal123C01 TaxID=3457577 RepID=UPI00403ED9CE